MSPFLRIFCLFHINTHTHKLPLIFVWYKLKTLYDYVRVIDKYTHMYIRYHNSRNGFVSCIGNAWQWTSELNFVSQFCWTLVTRARARTISREKKISYSLNKYVKISVHVNCDVLSYFILKILLSSTFVISTREIFQGTQYSTKSLSLFLSLSKCVNFSFTSVIDRYYQLSKSARKHVRLNCGGLGISVSGAVKLLE